MINRLEEHSPKKRTKSSRNPFKGSLIYPISDLTINFLWHSYFIIVPIVFLN